jgi:hypothetical protein
MDPVFRRNEATLLLNLLAYELMHAARTLIEVATGEGWSLRRLRELVLKAAVTVRVHARGIKLSLARSAARYWQQLPRKLGQAHWQPS